MTTEQFKLGDHVRFTGTKEQDIYHGTMVGREGIINQLRPYITIDRGDGLYWVVGSLGPWPLYLEAV